jgi:hypothetical protein
MRLNESLFHRAQPGAAVLRHAGGGAALGFWSSPLAFGNFRDCDGKLDTCVQFASREIR